MDTHGWSCPLLSLHSKVAPSTNPAPLNSTLAELPLTVTPRLMRWAEQPFPSGTTTEMVSTTIRSSAVVTMARTAYVPGTMGPMVVRLPGGPEEGTGRGEVYKRTMTCCRA